MTSNAKFKRSASPDLQQLDARLDRIVSSINPITPYQLKIPTSIPFNFANRLQQSIWTKDTPFSRDEGELQYISNIAEWPDTLIQAVGEWDDGNGGIKRRLPPARTNASATPSVTKKVLKFGEYTAAKKSGAESGRTQDSRVSLSETKEERNGMQPGMAVSHKTNSLGLNVEAKPRKRSRDSERTPGEPDGMPQAEKKPRKSPMLEDTKPTLPPPMTPLPENLREALAEYKKRQKQDTAREEQSRQEEPQAQNYTSTQTSVPSKAHQSAQAVSEGERPQKGGSQSKITPPPSDKHLEKQLPGMKEPPKEAIKQPKPAGQQALPVQVTNERSCIVKLKFRKHRSDVARLLKLPPRQQPQSHKIARSDISQHSSRTPEPTTMAGKHPTPRTSSPTAIRVAGKALQTGSATFELEVEWNTLAVKLKKKSERPDFRQAQPSEALVTFVTAAIAFIVQATIKARYRPAGDGEVVITWDGLVGALRRFRGSDLRPSGTGLMTGLLWYLEGIMLRESAFAHRKDSESPKRLKSMTTCLSNSVGTMNPDTLKESFPRTWAGQSNSGDLDNDDTDLMLRSPLHGRYTMVYGMGTALETARAARLMVIEWCENKGLKYDDELARLGGV